MQTKQTKLPLAREDRLAALYAVKPSDAGIGVRSWRSVRELLRQVELCGGASEGSHARVEVLAVKVGCTKRSIPRLCRKAEKLGLLVVTKRFTTASGAQRSNQYKVQWGEIVRLAQMSSPPGELSSPPDELSPPPDDSSALNRELDSSLEKPTDTVDCRDDRVVDWQKASALAEKVHRVCGRPRCREDGELALKAAVLVERYGERWLWDACEGVRLTKPRNPYAYLFTCLDDGAKKLRRRLRRDLAGLGPPPAPPQSADLSRRLCASGGFPDG